MMRITKVSASRCSWPFIGAPINHALGVLGREIRDLGHYFLVLRSNVI